LLASCRALVVPCRTTRNEQALPFPCRSWQRRPRHCYDHPLGLCLCGASKESGPIQRRARRREPDPKARTQSLEDRSSPGLVCSVLKSQIWWTSDDIDEMWDFGPFAPDSHAATSHVDSVTTCAGSSQVRGWSTASGRRWRVVYSRRGKAEARGPLAEPEVPDDLRYKTARESVRAKALRANHTH
jgi:hypothetical protein